MAYPNVSGSKPSDSTVTFMAGEGIAPNKYGST